MRYLICITLLLMCDIFIWQTTEKKHESLSDTITLWISVFGEVIAAAAFLFFITLDIYNYTV